ncbi:MAG: hypothetical protein ACYTFY_09325 [Planctomycetota bacterium]|jgi:hypothetical protein
MKKVLAFLVMTLSFSLTSCSGEKTETAVVKVTSLGEPCSTSRLWVYELSKNLKGETVLVGEFMNYKNTSGRKTKKHHLSGGRHYVAYTDTKSRPDSEWLILNLTTGRSKVVKLPGFHSTRACRAANGRIFFGIDFGHIVYYEPAEDTVKMLAQVMEWKPYTNDRTFYRMIEGPDGMIYCSTQSYNSKTSIIKINPDTLEYKVFPEVGTGTRKQKLTYGYYLQVDPPWAYVAVGQDEWELFAVNTETGEYRLLAERRGKKARVTIKKDKNAVIAQFYGPSGRQAIGSKLDLPDSSTKYKDGLITEKYWCMDGAIQKNITEKFPAKLTPVSKKKYKQLNWQKTKPITFKAFPELNTKNLMFDSSGKAEIMFRPVKGKGQWNKASFRLSELAPCPVESLTVLPDGKLFGSVKQYQGFFWYNPKTNKIKRSGLHGPSRATLAQRDGNLYFCGYPSTNMWKYDYTKDWKSTGTAKEQEKSGSNPLFIGYFAQQYTEAHYCHFLEYAENDRIYICGKRERWSTGTGLGYYDVKTKKKFGLGTAMKDIYPMGMLVFEKLDRVVVSGRLNNNPAHEGKKPAEAKLRIYDLNLKHIEDLAVIRGMTDTGQIIKTARPDVILGRVEIKKEKTTQMTILYTFSIKKKKLLQTLKVKGKTGEMFFRKEDSTIWLIKDNKLCKINTNKLSIRPIAVLEGSMQNYHLFVGKTLYAANGGELVKTEIPLR